MAIYTMGICMICGEETEKDVCPECEKSKKRIKQLMDQGHAHHCACRQEWGNGECECSRRKD